MKWLSTWSSCNVCCGRSVVDWSDWCIVSCQINIFQAKLMLKHPIPINRPRRCIITSECQPNVVIVQSGAMKNGLTNDYTWNMIRMPYKSFQRQMKRKKNCRKNMNLHVNDANHKTNRIKLLRNTRNEQFKNETISNTLRQ